MTPDELEALAARLDAPHESISGCFAAMRDAAAALRACAERQRAEEWQPIETAPKDTVLMLFRPGRGGTAKISFGSYNSEPYERNQRPFWQCRGEEVWLCRRYPPTHWRPRPAPPAEEG